MKNVVRSIVIILAWQIPLSIVAYTVPSVPSLYGLSELILLFVISLGIGVLTAYFRRRLLDETPLLFKTNMMAAAGLLAVALLWAFVLHEPVAIRLVDNTLSSMEFGGLVHELSFGDRMLTNVVSAIFSRYSLLFATLAFLVYIIVCALRQRSAQVKRHDTAPDE